MSNTTTPPTVRGIGYIFKSVLEPGRPISGGKVNLMTSPSMIVTTVVIVKVYVLE